MWKNLVCCKHSTNSTLKIKQFFSKIKSVFFNKVRKLHQSRDIQTLNWNFVIQIFKNIEYIRFTVVDINSDQTLIIQSIFNFSDSDQWSRSQQLQNQLYSLSDQSQNNNWNQDFSNHWDWDEERDWDRNQNRNRNRNCNHNYEDQSQSQDYWQDHNNNQ